VVKISHSPKCCRPFFGEKFSYKSKCRRTIALIFPAITPLSPAENIQVTCPNVPNGLTPMICMKQECAAVEGLPAMGPSLQLSTCVLPHGDSKCCHLVNHLDWTTLHGERALVVVDFSPTTQLAAVTLTFDLEIGPRDARVPGTLPTKFGICRPFRFPSRWRHGTDGQTNRRTGSIHDGASF